MFKPLVKISQLFECDPQRTVLIDDSPYKGCASPENNCLFPRTFNEKQTIDNMLMDELLPYLLRLDDAMDIHNVICSDHYGQPSLSEDNEYKAVIDVWRDHNLKWSQMSINIKKLPPTQRLNDKEELSTTSSSKDQSKGTSLKEILAKEAARIHSMKGPQLITLARKLGCTTASLKPLTAKAYIKKLLNENNLLKR
ncbi:hypothetical protein L7F22_000332 [Adiantum nelumboides]|nr:hypothetical protein [Adiantum nelumboides]